MKLHPLFFTAFIGLILIYACSKDEGNSTNTTQLQIQITDGPGDYQQVNVDIQEIRGLSWGPTIRSWLIACCTTSKHLVPSNPD